MNFHQSVSLSLFIGTSFKRIYPEAGVAAEKPNEVKKIVFCSGKTYYDLHAERQNRQLDSQVAIVRIEQLCPFPFDLIRAELEKYPNAKICFAQEEHKNMGPVRYEQPSIFSSGLLFCFSILSVNHVWLVFFDP